MEKKLGRPKNLKPTVRTTINLEVDLLEKIGELAKRKNMSVSAFIRKILEAEKY